MIAKAKSISHTEASIAYASDEVKEGFTAARNLLFGDVSNTANEMKFIQVRNERCINNTIRIELSPDPKDFQKLREENMWKHLPWSFTYEFGKLLGVDLETHQWISFLHNKAGKDNTLQRPHLHIYINRIDISGKAIPDKFISKKANIAADRIAKNLGLHSAKDLMLAKQNEHKQLSSTLIELARRSTDIHHFIAQAKSKGIEIFGHRDRDKNVKGLKVLFNERKFKISDIHRSLTLKRIGSHFISEGQLAEIQKKELKLKRGKNRRIGF